MYDLNRICFQLIITSTIIRTSKQRYPSYPHLQPLLRASKSQNGSMVPYSESEARELSEKQMLVAVPRPWLARF